MDTEEDYDYAYLLDTDGAELAKLDGQDGYTGPAARLRFTSGGYRSSGVRRAVRGDGWSLALTCDARCVGNQDPAEDHVCAAGTVLGEKAAATPRVGSLLCRITFFSQIDGWGGLQRGCSYKSVFRVCLARGGFSDFFRNKNLFI